MPSHGVDLFFTKIDLQHVTLFSDERLWCSTIISRKYARGHNAPTLPIIHSPKEPNGNRDKGYPPSDIVLNRWKTMPFHVYSLEVCEPYLLVFILIILLCSRDVTCPHYDIIRHHVFEILKFWNMAQKPECDRPLERRSEMQENEPSYDFLCQYIQQL